MHHSLRVLGLLASFIGGGAAAEPNRVPPAALPSDVTGALMLAPGQFAVRYAYQRTRYEQMRDGRDPVSAAEVLTRTGYQSAPARVDVERNDVSVWYSPVDRVTLIARLPILEKSMLNQTRTGGFKTRSSGVGDLDMTAVARFMKHGDQQSFVSLGLGAPTGSIRARGNTPSGRERLPYPMQLGAGVWSLRPVLSYRGEAEGLAWGGQAASRVYLGDNALGYRPGNHYRLMGWLAGRWTNLLTTSLQMEWQHWGNIKGRDRGLDVESTPVADPMEQKGERLDMSLGVVVGRPKRSGPALEFEATLPLWERLDGPQPSFDWRLQVGLRWAL